MNYEKKYNEALEVMRQWIAPCHTKEQLDTLKKLVFPELAESEDERIRKAIVGLIEELQRSDKNFAGVELTDMLAYLEKQKPIKMEVYEAGKGTTVCGQDYKCKKDYKEGNCWYIKDVVYHCSRDGYLTDQNGISWSCTPEWFKEYIQSNTEWSENTIRKAVKEVGLTQHQINWFKNNVFPPKPEWSEEDEKKLERVDDLLWMLDDYLGNDCSICEEKTARLRDEIHNELFPWLEFLRPQYHGDVTMTEAYKMGLEAGKASSWKPSEEQTNNVIVELTRIELGDIINGLYYLKEKYYEDCKEHNGTATIGLSDEFKFYFKRFNEVLDLYTRLHELEKERYGTITDGYYYE